MGKFSNIAIYNVKSLSFILRRLSQLVPQHEGPNPSDIENFRWFIKNHDNILILTGAGISTESGIPDYRSEGVGLFSRTSYKPIQYSEFIKNPDSRSRYWARNFIGWPKFCSFSPNTIHFFVADFQNYKHKVVGLITQNVDGLHSKAGSQDVLELHGNAFWVKCLQCNDIISRYNFQQMLEDCNPFMKASPGEIRPDGDVELSEGDIKNFEVPACQKCGGIYKPTIVFFGENISPNVVKKVENLVVNCDAMLILGTSLSTLSSSRIVEQACDSGKYICLVNIGKTRCDKLIDLKINAKISNVIMEGGFK